jgi:hypothetical protein
MPFTGPFPKNDKLNLASFRAAEMKRQGTGFKNARAADADVETMPLTNDTAMDPFPAYKTGKHSPEGKTVHTKAGKSDLPIKTKARPFGGYESPTPPPKGRALPHRGEGATTNSVTVSQKGKR